MNKKILCFIVSSKITIKAFLREHIKELQNDYNLVVIANISEAGRFDDNYQGRLISLSIQRKINLVHDFLALIKLYKIFRRENFDIIHSVTPKAGFLSMLAGSMANVPVRVHTFTGQVWANKHGFKRKFFKFIDTIIARLATNVLVDSQSQRDFLLNEKVVSISKSRVLLHGSICGVDVSRFSPNEMMKDKIRKERGIADDAIVLIYLGRISLDKGVIDLVSAFTNIAKTHKNVHLMIIGPDEDNLCDQIKEVSRNSVKRIHILGYTNKPEDYMAAADIFCLPSYREGFGNVVIEAGATGIPTIGSRVYGITDAIQEGVTGLLFEPHNIRELETNMLKLILDNDLRKKMGKNAAKYARSSFDDKSVTGALKEYYTEIQ